MAAGDSIGAPIAGERCSLVTGGGRGIGRAVALRLAGSGPVIVVGRTAEDLAAVCREIAAGGGVAEPFVGDVADPETAKKAAAFAEAAPEPRDQS